VSTLRGLYQFITLALQDELHPKLNIQEDKNMGNMRTLAFQVPEELFRKIKDYLQRNNVTQKDFVIGLIETEIERDLTQRAAVGEGQTESAAVSDCEDDSEEVEDEIEEQERSDFDDENKESEDIDEAQDESEEQSSGESDDASDELDDEASEDIDEDQDESKDQAMSMGM